MPVPVTYYRVFLFSKLFGIFWETQNNFSIFRSNIHLCYLLQWQCRQQTGTVSRGCLICPILAVEVASTSYILVKNLYRFQSKYFYLYKRINSECYVTNMTFKNFLFFYILRKEKNVNSNTVLDFRKDTCQSTK